MTERNRNSTTSTTTTGYNFSNTLNKMENELSPRKTMLVLVIVVGCFAVLWPKVFYPMLMGSVNQHIKPSSIDKMTGCCDVISETDINTIKIMNELCGTIIKSKEDDMNKRLNNKEIVQVCRQEILATCGIDISAVLQEQVRLGQNIKQILDEIRSLNGSLCLKYNYGIAPWRLGVPHRITIKNDNYIRQERPHHLRSELIHPAFRERGRAIPQPQQQSSKSSPITRPTPPRIVDGRPGPIPGMRPTIGGAGHVVPPSKQGTSSMSVIMPIYTIGIVIFFTYTLMKIIFRKQPEGPGGGLYPPIEPDPHFRKEVFESDRGRLQSRVSNGRENKSSKLVVNAMSALLDEVDQEIEARRKSNDIAGQDLVNGTLSNGNAHKHQDTTIDDQPTVKVLGMEMRASCEGGQKWSRPSSPILPTSSTPQPPSEPIPPPQEIYLEGALPAQSHLLVSDSATEPQPISGGEDPAVVLAGKMTLSVISLDSSENGGSNKSDEERQQLCEEIDQEIRELEKQEIISENAETTESTIKTEPETSETIIKGYEIEETVPQADPEVTDTKHADTDTVTLESEAIKEQELQVSAKSDVEEIKEPEAKTESHLQSQSELEFESKEQVEETVQQANLELIETKPTISDTEKLQLEVQTKFEPEAVKDPKMNQEAQMSGKSEIEEVMWKIAEVTEPEAQLESQIKQEPVAVESEMMEEPKLDVQTIKHINPELAEIKSEVANVEVLQSEHQTKSEPLDVKTTETEEKPLDSQTETEITKMTVPETESVRKETEQLVDKTEAIQEFVEEHKENKNIDQPKLDEKEVEDVEEEVDDLINEAVEQVKMLQEFKTTAEIEELVKTSSQASSEIGSDEEVEIEEIVYTSNEEEEVEEEEEEDEEEQNAVSPQRNRTESSEHKRVNGDAGGAEESKHTTTTSHTAAENDISEGTDEEVEDDEEEIIEIVDDEEDDEEEEEDNGDIDLNHIAAESGEDD